MHITDLIAATKAAIVEYQATAQALRGVILAQAFVVKCHGLFLTFDIDAAGEVVNPQRSEPHRARRFSRRDAEAIAARIRNSDGRAGEVVHVRLAVEDALFDERRILGGLETYQRKALVPNLSIEASA